MGWVHHHSLNGHVVSKGTPFSSCGRFVLTGTSDHRLIVTELATGTMQFNERNDTRLRPVELASDLTLLMASPTCRPSRRFIGSKKILEGSGRIQALKCGEREPAFEVKYEELNRAIFSANGRVVVANAPESTCTCGSRTTVWDIKSNQVVKHLLHHPIENQLPQAVDPEGTVVVAQMIDDNTKVDVWSIESGDRLFRVKEISGRQHVGVSFSPSGELFATWAIGQPIEVWSVNDASRVSRLPLIVRALPNSVSFSNNSRRLLVTRSLGHALVFDTQSGVLQAKVGPYSGAATFSPCAEMVATHGGNAISLHEIDTGRTVETLHIPPSENSPTSNLYQLPSISWSQCGHYIVSNGPEAVCWLDNGLGAR